jgi:quinol monooxygenase YgiN
MMGLPAHVHLTRAEPGCLSFNVVPTGDPLIWQVDEAFADRAAFDAHQVRAADTDWAALTKDIARDYVITEDGTA